VGAGDGLRSVFAGRAVCRLGFGFAAARVEWATGGCVAVPAAELCVGTGCGAAVLVGAGAVTTVFTAAGCVSAFAAGCVPTFGVTGLVCVVTGASGAGVAVAVAFAVVFSVPAARVAGTSRVAALTGASAIRGEASLRGPAGGSSGVGTGPAQAGPASAATRAAAHAATAISPRRSVRRRDDVLVDTRPSLFR